MRVVACLLICIGLVGCVPNDDHTIWDPGFPSLISFVSNPDQPEHHGYSAFDGNLHDYQIVASVPSASDVPTSEEPDPVLSSSLVWTVDESFLKKDVYADLNAAILLTTKRSGTTVVKLSGTRSSGKHVAVEASVAISTADGDQWAKGDERYNSSVIVDSLAHRANPPDTSQCDLPASSLDALPKMPTCSNCHDDSSGIATAPTPAQIAGYSDDDLIKIFTTGWKPPELSFTSDILKTASMPECVFEVFHTWPMSDDAKKGVVWKLRSMKPRAN